MDRHTISESVSIDRPKVARVVEYDGIHYEIFEKPVKQRFKCGSCGERTCIVEIEDTEDISFHPRAFGRCFYTDTQYDDVNWIFQGYFQ